MTVLQTRAQWGALPPKSNPGPFKSLEGTVCHYTAADRGYMIPSKVSHDRCVGQVKGIQRHHLSITSQSDIQYSHLACNHGVIFEGRVPGYKTGANGTATSNATMPSVCILAGVNDQPEDACYDAVRLWHAKWEDRAGRSLLMRGHREISSTSCPGDLIYAWVTLGGYRYPPVTDPGPTPEPTPKPPLTPWLPSTSEDTVLVIAAPRGANARFLAISDGRGFIGSMTWIPTEERMNALTPHYPVVDIDSDATKNIGLTGPVPHGDSLRDWTVEDFLNAS